MGPPAPSVTRPAAKGQGGQPRAPRSLELSEAAPAGDRGEEGWGSTEKQLQQRGRDVFSICGSSRIEVLTGARDKEQDSPTMWPRGRAHSVKGH